MQAENNQTWKNGAFSTLYFMRYGYFQRSRFQKGQLQQASGLEINYELATVKPLQNYCKVSRVTKESAIKLR